MRRNPDGSTAPLAHQDQEPTPGVMVLLVGLQMPGELADALREDRDLDLGGTRVRAMKTVLRGQPCLYFAIDCQTDDRLYRGSRRDQATRRLRPVDRPAGGSLPCRPGLPGAAQGAAQGAGRRRPTRAERSPTSGAAQASTTDPSALGSLPARQAAGPSTTSACACPMSQHPGGIGTAPSTRRRISAASG